ncbi:MAG TPA: hypothetical protein VFI55_04410 [Mycobacterium sp.]|nr:hypothetical protein [Mycobacterium sp.]
MRGWAIRRHARWVDVGVALVVLAVLIVVGRVAMFGRDDAPSSQPSRGAVRDAATQTVPRARFSGAEQQIVGLLPPGYSAAACTRAVNPFPSAVASLDCSQNTNSDTPTYARFTLYNDMDALTGDFQLTADGMAVSACPGENTSRGTWSYRADAAQISGKIVCGIVADRANIAWTRDDQLLLATVNGGPDLTSLYRWWRTYGGMPQR